MISTTEELQRAIAWRAQEAIGTRFRLHGRNIITGLDCVGLVAHAIEPMVADCVIPQHYQLRFDDLDVPRAFFEKVGFDEIGHKEPFQQGDIIMVAPACLQLHFIVMCQDYYIHAHSVLRRVVQTNLPILSPVKAVWRYKGE